MKTCVEGQNTTMICITGGIGSGKSVVSRVLRLKGFPVYDCDSRAKELMCVDPQLKSDLEKTVGKGIYFSDGSLDRARLASLIFTSKGVRERVNRLVHAAVINDVSSWSGDCGSGVVFVETAIPVTSGMLPMFDRIWMIDASEELRMRRACRRDNVEPEVVRVRMKTQDAEFSDLPADLTVRLINDGYMPLLPQIDDSLKTL